ncbi:CD83 antigen [Fukomys damarensis]|uniref:CD83 antigen n=1 Tax=Fukomys damarensis TaxID=885580 RepID=UPI00053FF0B2|nr:CD83 antigen [Fukomys damarensis]
MRKQRWLSQLKLALGAALSRDWRSIVIPSSGWWKEATLLGTDDANPRCQHNALVASPQLTEGGEERLESPQEDLRLSGQSSHQRRQNNSSESPERKPYSLKIQNTTSCSSGTYRCTLQELGGHRNLSGMVTLKVTGCFEEPKESTFKKYRAEIVLLFSLVIFYLTLIIFTCKFARLQSIFPDFSKPGMERAFLPVTSPNKHLGPVTVHKTEVV